jgi:hypothetical protein
MVLPMVGAGIKAVGDIMSLKANAAQARYQQGYAEQLAGAYQTRGQQMQAAGYQQAADVGLRAGASATRQEVYAAAGNVAGPSVAGTIASTRALGQLAQRTTIANAGERAYGEYLRGAEETAKAGLYGAAASQYTAAIPVAVAGDIVGGLSTASGQAMQAQQYGLNPVTFQPTAGGGGATSVDPKWLPPEPSADQGYYY